MEKHTLSHYGWVVILIIILCLLVSLATPFGVFVKDSALDATRSFVGLAYNALGLEKPLSDGSRYFAIDNTGTLYMRPLYADAGLKETKKYIEEWGLSKNATKEYIAYLLFSGSNIIDTSVEEWKELGISKSELKLLARNFIFDKINYDEAVVAEMNNNPNCTTFKQAILNLMYDFSEIYIDDTTPRATNQNVTEEEINQLWRSWAVSAREELLNRTNAVSSNTEAAINMLIAQAVVSNNIVFPEDESEFTREFVYDTNKSFMQSKLELDIWYSAVDAVLYNVDSLSYRDVIGVKQPLFYLFSIDELVAMADNKGADIEKASVLALDGFRLSEYIDLIYEAGEVPDSFEIPEEINGIRVTQITRNTGFLSNNYIYEVRLPESLYKIGEDSFNSCSNLSHINLNNVSVLETGAFPYCTNLKKVELSPLLDTVPQSCFESSSGLKEVIINDGTTSILDNAFRNCSSLEKVVIPDSVTSIGDWAFVGCSQKLIIYGTPGSYAETFANNKGIAFSAIEE